MTAAVMADDLGSAAAIVLAVVFGWAGVAKARRRVATAASFRALRVPAADAMAVAVPAIEIVLAVALLVAPAAAAWPAALLLIAFTAVVMRAIALDVDAPCSCFGSARAEPVSSTEVIRNALLLALAVVATGAPARLAWPGLPALVVVTVAGAIGRVGLEALDLRRTTGSFWPHVPHRGGTP